ncbi:hypothetical protein OH76DRAFT_1085338 [Lentinus brumalis]|uniref:Uncharacterized protein n=1 Tax=Lentinus brumalis TaxID=2498619 RepID=A0A371DP89_9APHY|nr:hypothetical protein OH76DRAFT_1085338 [Polyporus brumalis]
MESSDGRPSPRISCSSRPTVLLLPEPHRCISRGPAYVGGLASRSLNLLAYASRRTGSIFEGLIWGMPGRFAATSEALPGVALAVIRRPRPVTPSPDLALYVLTRGRTILTSNNRDILRIPTHDADAHSHWLAGNQSSTRCVFAHGTPSGRGVRTWLRRRAD